MHFNLLSETAIAAKFETKGTAFERVHALEQDHQVEPQYGRRVVPGRPSLHAAERRKIVRTCSGV